MNIAKALTTYFNHPLPAINLALGSSLTAVSLAGGHPLQAGFFGAVTALSQAPALMEIAHAAKVEKSMTERTAQTINP